MARGGNVERKGLLRVEAVENLFVSGTITTSGSMQLGQSLIDSDSHLILSSSAGSRIVVSGTLNVLESLLVQGVAIGANPVTGSDDFDLRGKIWSTRGEVTLSSSAITHTASVHTWFVGGNKRLEISNNVGAVFYNSALLVDSPSGYFGHNNGVTPVRLGDNATNRHTSDGMGSNSAVLIAGAATVIGTLFADNGIRLTGSIRADNGDLILSSSAGSRVYVSGNLSVLGGFTASSIETSGRVSLGSAGNRAAFRGSGIGEATLETVDGGSQSGLRLAWLILNSTAGLSAQQEAIVVGDTSLNFGSHLLISANSGSVRQYGKPLILSGATGVYVSGTLRVLESLSASNGNPLVLDNGGSMVKMSPSSNGRLLMTNAAGTDFGWIQLGGTTDSFPGIQRDSAGIAIITAGLGGYSTLRANNITANQLRSVEQHLILSSALGSLIAVSGALSVLDSTIRLNNVLLSSSAAGNGLFIRNTGNSTYQPLHAGTSLNLWSGDALQTRINHFAGIVELPSAGRIQWSAVTSGTGSGAAGILYVGPQTLQATNGSSNIGAILSAKYVQTVTSPTTLDSASTVGRVYTNTGATSRVDFTLPSAGVPSNSGNTYTFIVSDTDGIRITAATGDTIRLGDTVSAAAGYAESLFTGSVLTLVNIDSTQWIATSIIGTWDVV